MEKSASDRYLGDARLALEEGDFAGCETILHRAIQNVGEFYLYYATLGDLYCAMQRFSEARNAYGYALQLNGGRGEWIRLKIDSLPGVCCRYERYPVAAEGRQAEGGRRLKGFLKNSSADQPLVTIVTAVFNNSSTFQRCIDSVKNQSYPNVEYIVVDGRSGAETLDIIKANEDFIDYYVSERDSGIYDAMNKGLELARGEYLCVLNSDDTYHPSFVERAVALAKSDDWRADIVYCGFYDGETRLAARDIGDGVLLGNLNINHCTFLANKRAYNKIGLYSTGYRIVSDVVWMRAAYLAGLRFKRVDDSLFNFSHGGMSSGNTPERKKLMISEIVRSYRVNFPFLQEQEAEDIYLLRFGDGRLLKVCQISEKYREEVRFSNALRDYVAHCFKDRDAFKLPHTESDGKFKTYLDLAARMGVSAGVIRINTRHGYFSELIEKFDKVLALRRGGRRKLILHYVTVFSAPSETFIYDLLHRLDAGEDYDNFVLFEQAQLVKERPFAKSFHVPWPELRPEVAKALYKYILAVLKPDLVLGHFAINQWRFHQRTEDLGLDIPFLAMTHGIDVFNLKTASPYTSWVTEDLAKRPNASFTAVSEFLKGELVSAGVPAHKVDIVHNTVSPMFWQNRKVRDFYDGERPLKVLSIGRLIEWKGHKFLLKALADFRTQTGRAFDCVIVYGKGGELLSELQRLAAELGIAGNVVFEEFVNFQESPGYIASFDIYIHCSTYTNDEYRKSETFGVSVLEAIAAGLPVITTNAGGLPEVIGADRRFAAVVPHGDAGAISKALVEFCVSGTCFSDNADYARERIGQFSAESQMHKLGLVIDRLIAGGPSEGKGVVARVQEASSHKVAMFSSSTLQGAGYAAYRLFKGLKQLGGVAPTMFTTVRAHEKEPGVQFVKHPSGDGNAWRYLQPEPKPGLTIFTVDHPNLGFSALAEMVRGFDVINVHWSARFLSVDNIAALSQLGKPVVLTVRDMNPITGGCHYFHGCNKWTTDCSACPQFPMEAKEYPAKVLSAKRRLFNFDNMTLVALSQHSKSILSRAPMFRDCRLEVINNSIEMDVFKPYDKWAARRKLGLPLNRKIIGYVPSFSSEVKGYKEIGLALQRVKEQAAVRLGAEPFIMMIGNKTPLSENIGLESKTLGYISDNAKLAEAYCAADLIVVPSLEETFSNTAAEAICCGVPVVGFETGAIPELAIDGVSGRCVPVGDVDALAAGIIEVLTGPNLFHSCRTLAREKLGFIKQAERYNALFTELIRNPMYATRKGDLTKIFPETERWEGLSRLALETVGRSKAKQA